jgi:hypothetical protein
MNFKVGNKTYEIIVASDVDRDGLGAEFNRNRSSAII